MTAQTKSSGAGKVWNVLASLLLVTAVLNLGWLVYLRLNGPPAVVREGGFSIFINPNAQFAFMKTRIAVALILSVLGLLIGKRKGLLISALALSWIIVEYVAWWVRSFSAVRESANASFSRVEHLAFLHYANWWDIWVFVIVAVVLISETRLMSAIKGKPLPRPILFN